MDDQQTYLLNGLIARHFGIGRIVRFRHVQRGRQAESYELFTAQEKEYLVHLFPATFASEHLQFTARAVNILDDNRFSVVPFLPSKQASLVSEGPQGHHMMLSLAPAGTPIAAAEYTPHDISQVGLRLAWMHRLMKEQLREPQNPASIADRFSAVFLAPGAKADRAEVSHLLGLLGMVNSYGWTHGDITPAALLHDGDHQLRTVADWGLLHWGCPLEDVVDAFLFLATNRAGELQQKRGAALLEAYHSLIPVKKMPWTAVVAIWCAQRMLSHERRDPGGESFLRIMREPERLATAMATCL